MQTWLQASVVTLDKRIRSLSTDCKVIRLWFTMRAWASASDPLSPSWLLERLRQELHLSHILQYLYILHLFTSQMCLFKETHKWELGPWTSFKGQTVTLLCRTWGLSFQSRVESPSLQLCTPLCELLNLISVTGFLKIACMVICSCGEGTHHAKLEWLQSYLNSLRTWFFCRAPARLLAPSEPMEFFCKLETYWKMCLCLWVSI